MMLPDGKGQLVTYEYTQADFVSDVLVRVPEVRRHSPYPYGAEEGVHNVLSDLAYLIRQAALERDTDVLERAFSLVNEVIERHDAEPEIENAVYLSFLSPKDVELLRDLGAWQLVSSNLKRYVRQEEW